jgi:hypothetical protein
VVRAAGMAINPDGCAERTSTTDTTRFAGRSHHLCLPFGTRDEDGQPFTSQDDSAFITVGPMGFAGSG